MPIIPMPTSELSDYAEVGMAGLGFVYLRQPLTYRFHADELGEDIYFWQEHPEIHSHLAKQIHWDTRSSCYSLSE